MDVLDEEEKCLLCKEEENCDFKKFLTKNECNFNSYFLNCLNKDFDSLNFIFMKVFCDDLKIKRIKNILR